jgi:hypothetical protein
MTEIHRVSVQIRRPMGDDVGEAVWGCYLIEGDFVVLVDSEGKALERPQSAPRRRGRPPALTRYERKLEPGENAERAAKDLLMVRYNATKRGSDFHRPIRYPPLGIA